MLRNASIGVHASSRCSRSRHTSLFRRPCAALTLPALPFLYWTPTPTHSRNVKPQSWRSLHARHVEDKWGPPVIRKIAVSKAPARMQSDVLAEALQTTIYALSSAPGCAGIAVVKISGPACLEIYYAMLKKDRPPPAPRRADTRPLYHPLDVPRRLLDVAVVVFFPQPFTQTGQDLLEFYIHGGNATVKGVLNAIAAVPSQSPIRYAEAGEFTRRAFYYGKLNIAQVEALGDQLAAETEQQHRVALQGQSKTATLQYESWRKTLLEARGEMEALIDFSEDQHFDESPTNLLKGATEKVSGILAVIANHIKASHCGELLRKGIRLSLIGPPNAGKSSLMNLIVGREASIVSPEAGTTRDIVEVSLDMRGYLCTFADTAGLRELPGAEGTGTRKLVRRTMYDRSPTPPSIEHAQRASIEREGIRRARAKASASDLVIVLASVEESSASPEKFEILFDGESLVLASAAPSAIVVVNKCERISHRVLERLLVQFKSETNAFIENIEIVTISCLDAQRYEPSEEDEDPGNIHFLTDKMVNIFESMTDLPSDLADAVGVSERSRQLLSSASQFLEEYKREATKGQELSHGGEPDIVIAAEHLREAAKSLALITGRGDVGDVEDVLGVVFERFCVGK
ncbi:hypothetical protein HYALB_00000444 [Hymenoscyphus albidus]|uniref:P-loop containing nucleoside triphosphate hydrolase protein n=1 Tax=Hymenoscyphus albidus TaxID=595503 RepID=A0A9N9LKN3_9HELO|nr:hypothetical protein HYALB_00000444 [Hymenoscyphus albidus]